MMTFICVVEPYWTRLDCDISDSQIQTGQYAKAERFGLLQHLLRAEKYLQEASQQTSPQGALLSIGPHTYPKSAKDKERIVRQEVCVYMGVWEKCICAHICMWSCLMNG